MFLNTTLIYDCLYGSNVSSTWLQHEPRTLHPLQTSIVLRVLSVILFKPMVKPSPNYDPTIDPLCGLRFFLRIAERDVAKLPRPSTQAIVVSESSTPSQASRRNAMHVTICDNLAKGICGHASHTRPGKNRIYVCEQYFFRSSISVTNPVHKYTAGRVYICCFSYSLLLSFTYFTAL